MLYHLSRTKPTFAKDGPGVPPSLHEEDVAPLQRGEVAVALRVAPGRRSNPQ